MVQKKALKEAVSRRAAEDSAIVPRPRPESDKAPGSVRVPELNTADRDIIDALTEFRDTLRDRTPLEAKYTVRQVVVVVPPPQLGPTTCGRRERN